VTTPPHERGFYLPPEWHPHRATWLSWPHNQETWRHLDTVVRVYATFAAILSQSDRICINVLDEAMARRAKRALSGTNCRMDNVNIYCHATDDCWIRDNGPQFIVSRRDAGGRLVVDWDFNAWGCKFPPFDKDNALPSQIAQALGLPSVRPGIVLEGGSVDCNGQGTCITTKSCVLNANRNPDVSQAAMNKALQDYYGIRNVLWLDGGIAGDHTDGHVDNVARFVDERTVVVAAAMSPADENWLPLRENLHTLKTMTLEDGSPLNVVEIPMPRALFQEGARLAASYVNFYIANKAVVMPTFGDGNDAQALMILRTLFKHRTVYGIDARALIPGGGGFHCLTLPEPLPISAAANEPVL